MEIDEHRMKRRMEGWEKVERYHEQLLYEQAKKSSCNLESLCAVGIRTQRKVVKVKVEEAFEMREGVINLKTQSAPCEGHESDYRIVTAVLSALRKKEKKKKTVPESTPSRRNEKMGWPGDM